MPFVCFNYLFCYVNKKPNILFTHRDLCYRFTYFFIMCSKLHSKRLTPILQLMVGMWFVHFKCFENGFLLKLCTATWSDLFLEMVANKNTEFN